MLAYMEWLVVNMRNKPLTWVFRQVLFLVFVALEMFYVCLIVTQDNLLSEENIKMVHYHCGKVIDPYEPLRSTFQMSIHSLSLVTALVGIWQTRDYEHKVHRVFSWPDTIKGKFKWRLTSAMTAD